jgi:hypothetical protein
VEIYEQAYGEPPPAGDAKDWYDIFTGKYTVRASMEIDADVPEEVVSILHKAFVDMYNDPEWKASADRLTGGLPWIHPDDANAVALQSFTPDPAKVEAMKNFLTEEYGAQW